MIKSSQGDTMTVGELIEALSKLDKNLPVTTEGCDCFGAAVKVSVIDNEVLIER